MRTPLVLTVLLVIFLAACSSAPPEPEREQQGWFVPPEPTFDRFVVDGTSASGGPPPMELELVCGSESNASTSWSFEYPRGRTGGATTFGSTSELDVKRAGDLVVRCTRSDGTSYESTYVVEPVDGGFTAVDFAAFQEHDGDLEVRARCEPYGGVGDTTVEFRFGETIFEKARGSDWDSERFDAPGVYNVTCRVRDEAGNVFEETIGIEVVDEIVFDPGQVNITIEPHERGGHCVVDGPVPGSFGVLIDDDDGFFASNEQAYTQAYFFERPGPGSYEVACSASYGNVPLIAEETLD